MCVTCGRHYHGSCVGLATSSGVRTGWQCSECKVCVTCRTPGEDAKMLVCDTCDKSFHPYCVRPLLSNIPKMGWKCRNCRVCGDCGARTPGSGPSSRWHACFTVCDSCYQQRNKGVSCPICGKAYRHSQREMSQCQVILTILTTPFTPFTLQIIWFSPSVFLPLRLGSVWNCRQYGGRVGYQGWKGWGEEGREGGRFSEPGAGSFLGTRNGPLHFRSAQ